MVFGINITVSWRLVLYASLASVVIGGLAGFRVAHTFDSYEAAKLALEEQKATEFVLREKIKEQQTVLDADAKTAQADEELFKRMEDEANDLRNQVANTKCLSADDVERLRKLFGTEPEGNRSKRKRSPLNLLGIRSR